MKMFRRIFALAMVIAMVCLFSASAFAQTIADSFTRNGISMGVYASIDRTSVYAESYMDSGDAVGNYFYIDVWCDYYIQGASGNFYLVNVTDDDAEDRVIVARDTWDCYLTYSPPDVSKMNFAEVTFEGEYNGYVYAPFPPVSYPMFYYE